jgi:hypothetical protein
MNETHEVSPEVKEAIVDGLLDLLSDGQVTMLLALLREARKNGYGEVHLLIEGKRLLMVKQESYDGGKLPDWP